MSDLPVLGPCAPVKPDTDFISEKDGKVYHSVLKADAMCIGCAAFSRQRDGTRKEPSISCAELPDCFSHHEDGRRAILIFVEVNHDQR